MIRKGRNNQHRSTVPSNRLCARKSHRRCLRIARQCLRIDCALETAIDSAFELLDHAFDSTVRSKKPSTAPSKSVANAFESIVRLKKPSTVSFGVAVQPVLIRTVLSNRYCSVLTSLSFLRSHCAASNCAFESTVLSSDFLIFPSESLRCFGLCFRIDCAQF